MAAAQENVRVDLEGDALTLLRQLGTEMEALKGQVAEFEQSVNDGVIGKSAKLVGLNAAKDAIMEFAPHFRKGTDAVYAYDASMRELEAITGATGDQLDLIGHKARESAKKFGGDAATNLHKYQILLSKLTPEIAKQPEALASMGDSVAALANLMGGDTTSAVNAATTAMNQFNINLDDPIAAAAAMKQQISDIASAARVGAVEVPGITDAITRSGASANAAGVEFREYLASIEVAGKFFGSTERLGTAMRGVMDTIGAGSLPKETLAQMESYGVNMAIVTDHGLSLRDRLMELRKIEGDGGLLEKVFGAGETIAGRALLQNLDLLEKYQDEIAATPNALEDMNAVIMGGMEQKKGRFDAWVEDMRLSLFSLFGEALPYLDMIGGGVMDAISLAPGLMALHEGWQLISSSTKLASAWTAVQTGAQWALNAAMSANPVFLAIAGVAALTAGIVYAWENFEGFRSVVLGLWESFKQVFSNIADFFARMFGPILEALSLAQQGEWAAAAVQAGKFLFNVATLPGQAIGEVMTGGMTAGVADAYELGKAKGKREGADASVAAAPGSGNERMVSSPAEVAQAASKRTAGSGETKLSGVSGGKIITVHIQQLVGKVENHYSNAKQNAEAMRAQVAEALIGAVRDFEMAGA